MNSNKIILILLGIFIISSAFFVTSCDIVSPTEGLEVRLNTISRETTVNVFLKDGVDNSVIRQSLTVTFEGANAAQIIDASNTAKTSFTTSSGVITFSVKDGTVFDADNPFTVNVRLETDGYRNKVAPVKIYSKGISTQTLFMNSDAKIQSVSSTGSAAGGTTDNNGSTQGDIAVTTNNGVGVNISSGTILKTDSGTPLVGNLTTTVQTVPLSGNNVAPSFMSDGTSNMVPAIQFSLNITDANGNSATNADQEINVKIPLGDNEINPLTGNPYQVGDKFIVFLDDGSGNYTKVGEGEYEAGLLLKTNLVGLGSLQLDGSAIGGGGGGAGGGGIILHSLFFGALVGQLCPMSFTATQSEIASYSFSLYVNNASVGTFTGTQILAASGVQLQQIALPGLTYRFEYQGTIVASGTTACGANNVTFNLSAIPTTYTINFTAKGVCEDKDPPVIGNLADAAYSYYPLTNINDINTGVVSAGVGNVSLTPGTYKFQIEYDGNTYDGDVTVGSGGTISQSGFDTSSLYFGTVNINGTPTTLTAANNPNIQGTTITAYVSIDCN